MDCEVGPSTLISFAYSLDFGVKTFVALIVYPVQRVMNCEVGSSILTYED